MTISVSALRKNHSFEWISALFVILSLVAAGLNYTYYPVIAHILTPSDFGQAQVLIALLLQISSVFSGLNLVIIYLVHTMGTERSRHVIESMQKIILSFFVVLTVLVLVDQGGLVGFFHLNSRAYIPIVALDLLTLIPFVVAYGRLQAHKHFIEAGSLQISVVGTKLLCGSLATVWWGVKGALLGFAIGQVLGMLLYWVGSKLWKWQLWDHSILRALAPPSRQELSNIRPVLVPILSIFVVNIVLVLFISFDIISARHYFRPEISGLYAGASTLSNAIVFVCLPLIGVLLPHLHKVSLRKSGSVFFRTSVFVLLVSGGGVILLSLFPNFLLSLFGHQYTAFAYLLWKLGLLMALVAFITLLLQVSAFYQSFRTAIICVLSLAGMIAIVVSHHASPSDMVSALLKGFAIIGIISLVQIRQVYGRIKD